MPFEKVLLVKPASASWPGFIADSIPLGIEYIAAYIQKHVKKVEIIDLFKDNRTIEYYLNKLKPDLVGISITYTIEHNESLKIARKAKEFGSAVVVGGYHATGLAEELAAHPDIDFVVRGEGEETMLELVKKGSAEGVKGVSYLKDGKVIHNDDRSQINDLDLIPYPARKLRKYKYHSSFFGMEYDAIMTSRGCWGRCKFCCEPMMCKGIQRYRKPDKIINELENILKIHKNKNTMMWVADPNFGGNPKITEELCDKLIEFRNINKYIDLKFAVFARVDITSNKKDLVRKMIKGGIDLFVLGLETPNDKHLGLLQKDITKKLQEEAVKNVKDSGGEIHSNFLIALPYQKEDDIRKSVDYAKKLEIDYPFIGIATPYPGTDLYKELKSNNLIIEKDWNKYDFYNLVYKHEFLTSGKTKELLLQSLARLYNDLLIKLEYRKVTIKKKKSNLFAFIIKHLVISKSAKKVFIGDKSLHLDRILNEFISPDLMEFTKEKGLHNIFEMSCFLRILGNQKIQITLNINDKPIISWVFKTTPDKFLYVDSINGKIKDATVEINIPIETAIISNTHFELGIIILINMLKDNKGLRAKFKLIRLFAAILFEISAFYLKLQRHH